MHYANWQKKKRRRERMNIQRHTLQGCKQSNLPPCFYLQQQQNLLSHMLQISARNKTSIHSPKLLKSRYS
ncbi:hypothetical protein MtrunA17_Chr1g0191451 [Medicago truncatula]|uniref:Uncharacterized protein n=1 Tax=Medicago truncatula TaxID=3880 RepID=A0A396JWQ3_MEDTR|nr:hypothetical protein MtrunA17_Chr1g0191451 [Medicago truncatula]